MKFSCDQCHAQYMIADEKLGDRGAKVKCKKCENIIIVKPAAKEAVQEEPAPAPEAPGFGDDGSAGASGFGDDGSAGASGFGDDGSAGASGFGDDGSAGASGFGDDPSSGGSAGASGVGDTAAASPEAETSSSTPAPMANEHSDPGMGNAFDSLFGGAPATGASAGTEEPAAPAPDTAEAGEREWYVAVEDSQVGPIDLREIEQRWDALELNEDSLSWKTGMADWVPIAEIPELAYLITERPQTKAPAALGSSFTQESTADGSASHTPAQTLGPVSFGGGESEGSEVAWKPSAASALSSLVQEELVQQPVEPPAPAAVAPAGMPDMGGMPNMAAPAAAPTADPFANAGGFAAPAPGFSMPTTPLQQSGGLRPIHLAAAVLFLGVLGLGGFVAYQQLRPQPQLLAQNIPPVVPVGGLGQTDPKTIPKKVEPGNRQDTAENPKGPAKKLLPTKPATRDGSKTKKPKPKSKTKPKDKSKSRGDDLDKLLEGRSNSKKPDKEVLSKADIVGGMKKNARHVMPCLQAAKSKGEIAPGKYTLTLNWKIKSNGGVSGGKMIGPSSLMNTSMPRCFARAMKRWKFPSSRNGAPVTRFPFGPFTVR